MKNFLLFFLTWNWLSWLDEKEKKENSESKQISPDVDFRQWQDKKIRDFLDGKE